jgi:glucose-1-phosphate thymidylyltransferase
MKGLIIAGGEGTRLRPLTYITNKSLLPVYNQPLLYYPLKTLINAGITEILIVSGKGHAGQILNLLGSGKEMGARISYEVQEEPGGIAQVVGMAEDFADGEKIVAILGDNVYEDVESIQQAVREFSSQEKGAKIFLKEVADPERFGVAEIDGDTIVGLEEKPKQPKSNWAVTGLYMYDNTVFDIVRGIKPSARGELEITDVNNAYIEQGTMSYQKLEGEWIDAGTFDSLLKASNLAKEKLAGKL